MKLQAAKDALQEEYFRRMQAADATRAPETAAAVSIQSFWRAHILWQLLSEWNGNALHVERIYRGHLGRVLANAARRERRIYWQRIYFSHCATSVQKWYRAYHSRRYKHNYYARKAYIEAVLQKSAALSLNNSERLQAQVEEAIASQELKARNELEQLSVKLHHLVSTKTTAGIYNSPMHDGFLPTAFSIPVEQHLRNAIKPQIREEMCRSAKGKLSNTKPKLLLSAALHEPYASQDERRRALERESKASYMALHGETFHTSTKHNATFAATQPSLQANTPYIDGGKQTIVRSSNKASWISSKPFHTAVPTNKLLESQ
mmetsp:Transcript_36711/g.85087  ORF Transcript_36711/g.85087 Transcript_36711/m.85087 type:complete len:318 (+) Transcript_36711:47-1000(+)